MRALIDADVLSYEIGYSGQFKDELTGDDIIRNFDDVAELLDLKIREILLESGSDDCVLYLTGDKYLQEHINRRAKFEQVDPEILIPNFRIEEAKSKPYKGTRKAEKPYHYHNLRAYMLSEYPVKISNGIEADDLMSIDLYNGQDVICCTRDKDLRMVPGWHYGWVCGKQPAYGPVLVTELGELTLTNSTPKKLKGTGLKFFYSQIITGDNVDNIPGLPKKGPVAAYNAINPCETEIDMFNTVKEMYHNEYGDEWEDKLREQVNLLWMIRELNDDGSVKFYEWPKEVDNRQT